jgi:hypothetical protein
MYITVFRYMLVTYQIYRELAQQKKEKEDNASANLPRVRNYENEQKAKIEEIRRKEEESGERYLYIES